MQTTTCIVCESEGAWAAALRRHIDDSASLRLVETRSPAEARDVWRSEQGAGSRAVLVAELSAGNAAAVCRMLIEHEAEVAAAPRMVVAARADAAFEWAAREAGATAFCTSPREIGPLGAIVARFAETEAARPAPTDERSTAGRLRAALPWSDAAR
jgi:hypothetical protein